MSSDEEFNESAWESLTLSVDPVEPPPELRQVLLGRLAGPGRVLPDGFFEVRPGVTGTHSREARWKPTPVPGIEQKVLSRDEMRGYTTRLVRFAPGTRYPKHRHAGTEEIFVLEGSLTINGTRLAAGDYCRSEADTEETDTFSEAGGMAIVISSDRDEIRSPSPP